jgi:predicted enzyme related to lactoylglutathione lyase
MAYTLNHLHLVCKDLQQMIDFFSENFDASLIAMKQFGGADGASLDLSGIMINLRVTQENEKILDEGKTFGYHHIGINVDDIDAKYEDLKGKGYAFSVAPKDISDTLRIAFFDGPENVTIELLQEK